MRGWTSFPGGVAAGELEALCIDGTVWRVAAGPLSSIQTISKLPTIVSVFSVIPKFAAHLFLVADCVQCGLQASRSLVLGYAVHDVSYCCDACAVTDGPASVQRAAALVDSFRRCSIAVI